MGRRSALWDLGELWRAPDARPVMAVAATCFACWLFLVYCVSASRSLVLTGAAWLTVFAMFSLASALISIVIRARQPSATYSFGLARAPVLAVFTSTVLAQLSSIFLIKESIERLLEGNEHSHNHSLFIPGTIAASVAQLLAAYAVRNEPFNHVLTAASSSWLQVRKILLTTNSASAMIE
uniref:Cation efflux protein transmembrane domain-containing protein n=1 Tax=Plectus sambesii TaxID=2011161 RepID=A0A914UZ83_9BILA